MGALQRWFHSFITTGLLLRIVKLVYYKTENANNELLQAIVTWVW